MNSQGRPLRTSTFWPFAFCLQCVSNEDNLLMHTSDAGARGFAAIRRRAQEDEAWGAARCPPPPAPAPGAEVTAACSELADTTVRGCDSGNSDTAQRCPHLPRPLTLCIRQLLAGCVCLRFLPLLAGRVRERWGRRAAAPAGPASFLSPLETRLCEAVF